MREILIGDVHGMLDALQRLVTRLNLTPTDKITFVGDLVDKGPDSAGVVKFVRELSKTNTVVLVEGNHEDKHKRFRKNLEVRPDTAASMAEKTPELLTITDELSEEDVQFLNSAVPFHKIDNHGILVVHAGIPGDMVEFPESLEEAASLTGKRKKKFNLIMRTRHVHHETGKMLQLGKETEQDPFWAQTYDGRFGHVVFGHEPFEGVNCFENATGIDTGAVFGNGLTAMILNQNCFGPSEFVTVPTQKFADPLHS